MQKKKSFFKTILVTVLVFILSSLPVCAAEGSGEYMAQPRYNNIGGVSFGISFDTNNVVYVALSVAPYSHGSGVSGIIKLFNSDGTCIAAWSVSDYVEPICTEVTYQGEYRETYTATFEGYAYSNNGTAPDRLELSATAKCQ